MNLKAVAIRALRSAHRHPTVDQIGRILRDDLRNIIVLDPQLNHITAEQARLCMVDRVSKLITEGRIYDGGVTRCDITPTRIDMDILIIPNRSIERIVLNFVLSA